MSTQMKNCSACGENIASSAKVCPHCGAKNSKPFFKKWWVWAIVIVILMIVLFSSSEEETAPVTTETTVTQEDKTETEETPQLAENTIADTYLSIAQNASTTFNLNEKAKAFMKEHSNYFPGSSDIQGAISDFVDYEITYAHLTKSINKYGDKLIHVSGDVIDISESDDGSLTYLHLSDFDGNNFIIYYLGSLDNIFEGNFTWGYALPLDIISFENMGGSYTEAVVCAGCYIDNSVQEY